MKVYSDSKVSAFLRDVTVDQQIRFLNEWNAKEGVEEDIFNYAIAYDQNNREPLFYESYPGSIVNVSQLQHTLKKAKSYGYEYIGFILDRGYFCKENICLMDDNGYDFVIIVKGMKSLVGELVLEARGSFENDRRNSIWAFKASGTTIKRKLYASDKKERYFHIYYDDGRKAAERERLEDKIDRIGR